MTLRASWQDNEERARWEAVIGSFHAVARLDTSTGRYMAFLEDNTTRGTNHYAPDSFSDPDAAKAWCEAEAQRLVDEEATLDPDAAIISNIEDELDGLGS
jgi:hypothetical protein